MQKLIPQVSYHVSPPNKDLNKVQPVNALYKRLIAELDGKKDAIILDPFARNADLTLFSNDLNPDTKASFHMDAADFLQFMFDKGIMADLIIFDPPFSPIQNKSTYKMKVPDIRKTIVRCKQIMAKSIKIGGKIVTSGWTGNGIGEWRGFKPIEFMIINHAGNRYATNLLVEQKTFEPIDVLWKDAVKHLKADGNDVNFQRRAYLTKVFS